MPKVAALSTPKLPLPGPLRPNRPHPPLGMPMVEWLPDPTDTPESPIDPPMADACDSRRVPAVVTLPTRFLVWAAALVLTLFGGGQFATLQVVSRDAEEAVAEALPSQRAMATQLTTMSQELRTMREQQTAVQNDHDRPLRSILDYQLEQDRWLRETTKGRRRPAELDRAAARIQQLAQR